MTKPKEVWTWVKDEETGQFVVTRNGKEVVRCSRLEQALRFLL